MRVEGVRGEQRLQQLASAIEVSTLVGLGDGFKRVVMCEGGVGLQRGSYQCSDSALRLLVVPVEVDRGAHHADELRIGGVDSFDDALCGGDVALIFFGVGKLIVQLNLLDGIFRDCDLPEECGLIGLWELMGQREAGQRVEITSGGMGDGCFHRG